MLNRLGFGSRIALLATGAILVACGGSQSPAPEAPARDILARVGDEVITRAEVERFVAQRFEDPGPAGRTALNDKALQSLIASRAMMHLARERLTETERQDISARVQAYEEELYVEAYLRENIAPRPVTGEMVQAYYAQNPEQFGAQEIRRFELLSAPQTLTDAQQSQLLAAVPAIQAEADWPQSLPTWPADWGLRHQRGRSQPGLLEPALEQALARLAVGETSPVVYLQGQLHLIRLTEREQTPPRPLSDVREDIREQLAPLLLREAVREASERARAQVPITLVKDNEQ